MAGSTEVRLGTSFHSAYKGISVNSPNCIKRPYTAGSRQIICLLSVTESFHHFEAS